MTVEKLFTDGAQSMPYWQTGNPDGKVIIMIHGFRGTHHGLLKIAAQLPNHRVILFDLPGFGEGERLESYALNNYVAWLHRSIVALNLSEPPLLLGHSFGSIITAAYAERYPKTIEKLILVNPIGAPALEGPKAIMTKLAIFYYWLGEKLPDALASSWLASRAVVMVMSITMVKTKDKKLRRYIHSQHLTYFSRFHSAKSVSQSFRTSTSHSVRDSAPSVHMPTLLIAGDKDDITPLHKQQELVKLFPTASLHAIENVGHLTHYETPREVANAIDEFLVSS